MNALVSICIPTYNGARYIRECLDSVLAQTFSDFEVLIVDDQSSDETLDIAKEYAAKDPRIRVTQNSQNLGLVSNWNRCVELAEGEWIKFVFQDDLIVPKCLEKMLAARTNQCPIICCQRNFYFEADTTKERQNFYDKFITKFSLKALFPEKVYIAAEDYIKVAIEQLIINFVGEPTAIMLHRSAFYKFGFFNPFLIQYCDLEYWTRVAVHTGIVSVPETLATFRVHSKSATNNNAENRYYSKEVLDKLIILHDFLFNPLYAPLRTVITEERLVELTKSLTALSFNARRTAELAVFNSTSPNSSLLSEWKRLLEYYPLLDKISRQNQLSRRIVQKINQIKCRLKYRIQ